MPTTTYDSPSSLRPEIGFKPDGFLGGMWADQNMNDYRQAVEQSNLMKALSAKQEMNKLNDYNLDAPVREAERLSKTAGFNASASTIGDIKGGEAADAQVKTGTVGSRIADENQTVVNKVMDYRAKLSTEKQTDFDRSMNMMNLLGPSLIDPNTSPLELHSRYESMKTQHPDLQLPEQYDPTAIKKHVQLAQSVQKEKERQTLIKETEQTSREAANHEADNISREKIARQTRDWHIEVANRAQGNVKTYQAQITKLMDKLNSSKQPGSKVIFTPEDQTQLDDTREQVMTEKSLAAVSAAVPSLIMQGQNVTPEAIGNVVRGIVSGLLPQKSGASSEAKWNADWAALPPGGSMPGLDGKTYTKKAK